jgi:hypothetical protein
MTANLSLVTLGVLRLARLGYLDQLRHFPAWDATANGLLAAIGAGDAEALPVLADYLEERYDVLPEFLAALRGHRLAVEMAKKAR